jgi:RNA polymerase primary sigma factor
MDVNPMQNLTADSIGQYLASIGMYPLLDADQEVELAQAMDAGRDARARLDDATTKAERIRLDRLIRAGDQARDRFVVSNLRLVVSNARRYRNGPVDMLDLIQEGNIGLMRAIEKFDWRKGFKFSTYATWWIRQAMQRALERSDPIRVPGLSDAAIAVNSAADELHGRLLRAPTAEELADATGIELDRVREALDARPATSIHQPIGEDGGTFGDLVADDDALEPARTTEENILAEALARSIADLDPTARRLIVLRYGLEDGRPRPINEIGDELGMSEHEIRMMDRQTVSHLADVLAHLEDLVAA